jgi:iron complex outermembrane receptor protein
MRHLSIPARRGLNLAGPPPRPGPGLGVLRVLLVLALPVLLHADDGVTRPAPTTAPATQPVASERAAPDPNAPAPTTTQPVRDDAKPGGDDTLDDFDDIDLLALDVPVVVTAARRPQPVNTVPNAVTVITAEDIRASGARSVPEALRLAAGVDVAQILWRAHAVAPRGHHGFTGNENLVLVDGRQIFDAYYGGTLWHSWPLSVADIERIEVIRGPAGVTWGANALNGVVNIITKDPADQQGLTAITRAGSRGFWTQYLSYGFKDDKLRMRVSGEYEASDGSARGGWLFFDNDDDTKHGRMSFYGIYDRNETDQITFSGGAALLNGGMEPLPLGGLLGKKSGGSQGNFLLGKWSRDVTEGNRFEFAAFVNDFYASTGLHAIDYRYQQLGLQYTHTLQVDDQHTLAWGIDTRFDYVDASNADPYGLRQSYVQSGIVGLYLQDTWQFAPSWTLNIGGRIDYDFYGGFEPSARTSLSYALSDNQSIYGAVSRSFAMPPGSLRFLDTPMLGGLFHVTADPGIAAQKLWAYELGYRLRKPGHFDTNLALYLHSYRNVTALPLGLGPPGLIEARADDYGNSWSYGVEWDGRWSVHEQVDLLGNYTYEWVQWHVAAPYHHADQVSAPKHKAMFGVRYRPHEDWRLSSHLYYVDAVKSPDPHNPIIARQVPRYLRLDLRAEYSFWKDQATLAVGVKNLLDNHHFEGSSLFLNSADVPRLFYAELRVSLP